MPQPGSLPSRALKRGEEAVIKDAKRKWEGARHEPAAALDIFLLKMRGKGAWFDQAHFHNILENLQHFFFEEPKGSDP
eukprot:1159340-Pelagomonas_calceolata.AAC.5